MDSPDVESSGLSSSLEEEFMIDLEEFGGFDPIIAFTCSVIPITDFDFTIQVVVTFGISIA